MKKQFSLLLALTILLSAAAGCTSGNTGGTNTEGNQQSTASGKSNTVAFCTMTAEGDYWNLLYNFTEEALEERGYQMDLVNADMDLALQIEQIENAVTQGYAGILVLAVDAEGVADATRRAVEAGVPVLAFIKDPGDGNRTASRHADEVVVGNTVVSIASDWVNEKYPDAEAGSINVIVVGGNSAGSETERFQAMVAAASENPVFNILESVQWETSQSYSMQATENILTKYAGDINIFIVGSGEMALGVREAVMASGSPIQDYSNFGIFTCDISAESAESIRNSVNDTDVIRGAAVNGGIVSEACKEMAEQMVACIDGTNDTDHYAVSAYIALPENLADFGY